MTIRSRNYIFGFMFTTSILVFIGFIVSIFFINFDNSQKGIELTLTINAAFASIFAIVGMVFFVILFKRIVSTELFFIAGFMWTLISQICSQLALMSLNLNLNESVILLLSRIYVFFSILGAVYLFVSSLHIAGLASQYDTVLFFLAISVSIFVSSIIPYDGSKLGPNFLYHPSETLVIFWFTLGLETILILNILKFIYYPKYNKGFLYLVCFALIILGRHLIEAQNSIVAMIVGWLALGFGLGIQIHKLIRKQIWF